MVEKTTNLFRVTGRIDRAIFINKGVWLAIPEPESINKGVWLSIPELEDSLVSKNLFALIALLIIMLLYLCITQISHIGFIPS